MPNFIKSLQDENKRLKEELEKKEKESIKEEVITEPEDQAPLDTMVEIAYGYSTGATVETLPLKEAFDKLVNYLSGFTKSTDKNVLRQYRLSEKHGWVNCNNFPCFIEKTYRDLVSGQEIKPIRRDVPLWLAVDDVVQKGQKVKLISRKEFMAWYDEAVKEDLRQSTKFQNEKERRKIQIELDKELADIK